MCLDGYSAGSLPAFYAGRLRARHRWTSSSTPRTTTSRTSAGPVRTLKGIAGPRRLARQNSPRTRNPKQRTRTETKKTTTAHPHGTPNDPRARNIRKAHTHATPNKMAHKRSKDQPKREVQGWDGEKKARATCSGRPRSPVTKVIAGTSEPQRSPQRSPRTSGVQRSPAAWRTELLAGVSARSGVVMPPLVGCGTKRFSSNPEVYRLQS